MLSLFETVWLLKPSCLLAKATRPWINTRLLVKASRPWIGSPCWWRQRNSWRYSLATTETEEKSKKAVRWQYCRCKHKAFVLLDKVRLKNCKIPKELEIKCCFVLRRDFHQCWQRKFSLFSISCYALWHNFREIHKLHEIKYSFTSQLLRTRKTAKGWM